MVVMTETILRKSATGEPGNKGEFGSKTNSEPGVELARSQSGALRTREQLVEIALADHCDNVIPRMLTADDARAIAIDAVLAMQHEMRRAVGGVVQHFQESRDRAYPDSPLSAAEANRAFGADVALDALNGMTDPDL